MMMRGVEKQNSVMKTSCLLGTFKEDARTRSEFLSLLVTEHRLPVCAPGGQLARRTLVSRGCGASRPSRQGCLSSNRYLHDFL